jgi:hypothetical protein
MFRLLLALLLFVSTAQAAILKVKIDGVIDPIRRSSSRRR